LQTIYPELEIHRKFIYPPFSIFRNYEYNYLSFDLDGLSPDDDYGFKDVYKDFHEGKKDGFKKLGKFKITAVLNKT